MIQALQFVFVLPFQLPLEHKDYRVTVGRNTYHVTIGAREICQKMIGEWCTPGYERRIEDAERGRWAEEVIETAVTERFYKQERSGYQGGMTESGLILKLDDRSIHKHSILMFTSRETPGVEVFYDPFCPWIVVGSSRTRISITLPLSTEIGDQEAADLNANKFASAAFKIVNQIIEVTTQATPPRAHGIKGEPVKAP